MHDGAAWALRWVAIPLLVLMGPPLVAEAAQAEFSDGDFNLSDYAIEVHQSNSNATITVVVDSSVGQPAPSLGHDTVLTGSQNSRVYYTNNLFTWNPQVQGALSAISYSIDRWISLSSGSLASWGATLLLEQSGNYYRYTQSLPLAQNTWRSATVSDLAQDDFDQVTNLSSGTVNTASHPDFTGGEIRFGTSFGWDGGSGGQTIFNRFDNLTVQLTYDQPAGVPIFPY